MVPPGRARRALVTALELAGWVAVVAGLVSAGARLARTPTHLAAMAAAITPLARLGVTGVAALAVAGRRQALATAALVAAMVLAPTVAVSATGHERADPSSGAAVRIVTANVLASNPNLAAAVGVLAARDADVIVLQEITPEHADVIESLDLDGRYPYRVYDPLPYFHGYALLSRWPVEQSSSVDVGGWPLIRARLDTPHGPIELVNVHLPAPTSPASHRGWQDQFRRLHEWADEATAPFVVAGDFNATPDHRELRELLDDGSLVDAWDAAGTGWGATYADPRFPMPLLRLDHVLAGPGWGVADIDTVDVPGSDHRGLVADLVLLDAESAE